MNPWKKGQECGIQVRTLSKFFKNAFAFAFSFPSAFIYPFTFPFAFLPNINHGPEVRSRDRPSCEFSACVEHQKPAPRIKSHLKTHFLPGSWAMAPQSTPQWPAGAKNTNRVLRSWPGNAIREIDAFTDSPANYCGQSATLKGGQGENAFPRGFSSCTIYMGQLAPMLAKPVSYPRCCLFLKIVSRSWDSLQEINLKSMSPFIIRNK